MEDQANPVPQQDPVPAPVPAVSAPAPVVSKPATTSLDPKIVATVLIGLLLFLCIGYEEAKPKQKVVSGPVAVIKVTPVKPAEVVSPIVKSTSNVIVKKHIGGVSKHEKHLKKQDDHSFSGPMGR